MPPNTSNATERARPTRVTKEAVEEHHRTNQPLTLPSRLSAQDEHPQACPTVTTKSNPCDNTTTLSRRTEPSRRFIVGCRKKTSKERTQNQEKQDNSIPERYLDRNAARLSFRTGHDLYHHKPVYHFLCIYSHHGSSSPITFFFTRVAYEGATTPRKFLHRV